MALVIENGSLVSGAVSYVSAADIRAFAAARMSTLPSGVTDGQLEAAAINAMDFMEALNFQGSMVDPSVQALQWPRQGVFLNGANFALDQIPAALKNAQCVLAIESVNGTDLMPTGDGREVIREKVDVIERQYSAGAGGAPQPVLTKALAFLAPLLAVTSYGGLQVGRI